MNALEFDKKIEQWQAEKIGRFGLQHGDAFLAEKKIWDEDGLQWLMYIAYGGDVDNLEKMNEVFYNGGSNQKERISSALAHAEIFLRQRDYYGDKSRR